MSELLGWLDRLFDDCLARVPFGVAWELDRSEPPLAVTVIPADMPSRSIRLERDDLSGRIGFAPRLQGFLSAAAARPPLSCPVHGLGLVPVGADDQMIWSCPEGDLRCRVGDYELVAFWPPTRVDPWVGPLLVKRLRRAGLAGGWASLAVEDRAGALVARIAVRPGVDEHALRAAAAPLMVEITSAPAISTVREAHAATDREPAHEVLALRGVAIRGARLEGELRRATSGEDCDFVVGDTRVKLDAEHIIGGPGSALLQDAAGIPFADEGDLVSCGGGFAPRSPLRGEEPAFHAGSVTVYGRAPDTDGRP